MEFDWPILGHNDIKKFLQTSIVKGTLSHAYVFCGPEKIGKMTMAKALTGSILCNECAGAIQFLKEKKIKLPCHCCEPCRQFAKNIHADVYLVEREINEKTGEKRETITVKQIREMQERINKRSFLNSYKVVIIRDAHCMSLEAGNSLLKTLEEPSAKTVLILTTLDRSLLLPTIISRCQVLKFLPITLPEIYQYLIEQGVNRSVAKELAHFAQGRPTVAMELNNNLVKFQEVKENNQQLLAVFSTNLLKRFCFVEEVVKKNKTKESVIKKLNDFSSLVRDLLLSESFSQDFLTHLYLKDDLAKIASRYSSTKLLQIGKMLEETKRMIGQNVNPRLALENLVINI